MLVLTLDEIKGLFRLNDFGNGFFWPHSAVGNPLLQNLNFFLRQFSAGWHLEGFVAYRLHQQTIGHVRRSSGSIIDGGSGIATRDDK